MRISDWSSDVCSSDLKLGIDAEYRRTLVRPDALPEWLEERRADPMWRGANLTIPHKEKILPLVQDPEGLVSSVGAMNIVIPDHGGAKGFNSDISGFAEPLDNVCLAGKRSEEHTSELQSLMRI